MDYKIPLYIQLKEMILQRIADGGILARRKNTERKGNGGNL